MGYEGRVAGWTDVVGCMEGCVRRLWAGSDWDDVAISAQALRMQSRPDHQFVKFKFDASTFCLGICVHENIDANICVH